MYMRYYPFLLHNVRIPAYNSLNVENIEKCSEIIIFLYFMNK